MPRRPEPNELLVEAPLEQLQELRRLQAIRDAQIARQMARTDVFAVLGYEPNCRVRHDARKAGIPEDDLPPACGTCPQELFHAANEYDVLYGGAAGGGKTKALVMEGIRSCVRFPGIRVGAFRRTNPELEESFLAELAEVGFARDLGARWNAGKYNLTFPNKSIIMFRYAENLQDATRRQGGQYQLLLFDERTLTPPDVCSFLESRLRSGKSDVPVLGIRSGTNPGGIGHASVKTRYIDPTGRGTRVATGAHGNPVRFIPSKLSDNPHLNPEYEKSLDALPEKQRAAFKDGSWDVFAGQMFSEWRHDRHTIAPITLPSSARRYVSMDWGFTAPWCVLWGAQDEDGRLWIYREIYRTQVGEADQAKAILAAEGPDEEIGPRWADDSMWDTRGDAVPIAQVYADNGVALTKAGKGPGSRVIGWQRIHSMLKDGPACPHHRAQGWETCPLMHVFTTCEHLIRTLPTLPHATSGNPEDADTKAEDHAPDALRYMVINIGGGPSFWLEPDNPGPARLQGVDPESQFGRQLSRTVAVLPNPDGTFWEPSPTPAGSVVIVGGVS